MDRQILHYSYKKYNNKNNVLLECAEESQIWEWKKPAMKECIPPNPIYVKFKSELSELVMTVLAHAKLQQNIIDEMAYFFR